MIQLDCSLIDSVRRRELNFERLVEVLSKEGYVTDADGNQGLGFIRTRISAARQEDFDRLWNFFYPGQGHDIQLNSCASDEGFAVSGGYTYALFNESLVSREEMMQTLKRRNAQLEREFPSMG
jgi:hypothetical protein